VTRAPGPVIAVVAVAGLLVGGCVTPAPSTSAYAAKAGMTADAAVSEVRTALVATDSYLHGRMTAAYLETLLVEGEEALGSVHDTFDSVQPPAGPGADSLRDALDPLLEDAGSAVTELRIAARRDRSDDLRTTAGDLTGVADDLEAFAKQHAS
jgi:hypothetical protein